MMKKANETAATSHRTRFIEERDKVEVEPFNERTAEKDRASRVKRVRIEEIPEEVMAHPAVGSNQRSLNLLGLSEF